MLLSLFFVAPFAGHTVVCFPTICKWLSDVDLSWVRDGGPLLVQACVDTMCAASVSFESYEFLCALGGLVFLVPSKPSGS